MVVDQSLQGKGDQLNEYLLGVDVYDRDETFDPRMDSIVRVDATRLRSKLREYYESEGRSSTLRIEIPKGHYKPLFKRISGTEGRASADTSHERQLGEKKIAVLPFADLSPRRDQEYFGDGIAEELMFALSRLPNVRVVSQTSVFAFKGKGLDIRAIGRQLGVESIIEGSIRKAEQGLRITAQLTDVGTGLQIWSEVFECELKDVFAVQEQISKAVAEGLQIMLFDEEQILVAKPATQKARS